MDSSMVTDTKQAPLARAPLCIDLDGTLIRSDLTFESLVTALRRSPWILFWLPLWLLRGKHRLKDELAKRGTVDAATLPYNDQVLALAREARRSGREVVLVTGSHTTYAKQVVAHTGVFDEFIASDEHCNLTGRRKAKALDERFGHEGYEYAGNDAVDLPVWRSAGAAVTVNAPERVVRQVARLGKPHVNLPTSRLPLRVWLKAVRIQQWVKNALIFIPVVTAHLILDARAIAAGAVAFLCFGLCASATYLINDLFDVQADRQHAKKRNRPLAAGLLEPRSAVIVAALLFASGLAVSVALPVNFRLALATYLVVTLLYSFWLKQIATLDVITLAGLYTLRIIAGALAVSVPVSFWLLAFSIFIFLSLAMVKRVAELIEMRRKEQAAGRSLGFVQGRQYSTEDIWVLTALGSSSAYLSVLVLAFYIQAPEVSMLYRTPQILWLLAPLMLVWTTRLWVVTARGYMNEDPIYYSVKDPETWMSAAISAVILIAATYVEL
jgi:4-hydroxybenzoate polyprenyltransferase/phosphoserine phosphatase